MSTAAGRTDLEVGVGFAMMTPLAVHGKVRSSLKCQPGQGTGVTAGSRLLSGPASARTGEILSPVWLDVLRKRWLCFIRTGRLATRALEESSATCSLPTERLLRWPRGQR